MHPGTNRTSWWKRPAVVPLVLAVTAIGLGVAEDASAAARKVAGAARLASRPANPRGSNRRDVIRPPAGSPASAQHREGEKARQQAATKTAPNRPGALARNGLPRRPLPGEAGFTGVPPVGETRFRSDEMMLHIGAGVSPQTIDAAERRFGLTPVGSQQLVSTGGTLYRFRIADGRQVADVVRSLEAEKIGTAQPNYVYRAQQDVRSTALLANGDPTQYAATKLRLGEAHRLAIGKNVLVAMIDTQIDATHPELAGTLAGQLDAADKVDKPDAHGTGMTGAIVAHRKLLGVAPGVRILAVHVFSPDQKNGLQATTQHILAGIDWSIAKGARIINMSFAGPYDPMLQLALKKARDKGIVLIAAAGNMGPKSPPLFPAADENVIAVTATDDDDHLFSQANQGPHIALAAPGVDVLEPAPNATYQLTTGTSVAAAQVTGVAALVIERKPEIDVAALEQILFSTAKNLGPKGRDSQFGFGLVDPYRALDALDPRLAADHPARQASAVTTPKSLSVSVPLELTPEKRAVSGMAPSAAALPAALPGPAVAAFDPDAIRAAVEKKRLACREDGFGKGMRGPDLQDHVALCVAEARLGCLKQAVAQKIRGPERGEFIGTCLGS